MAIIRESSGDARADSETQYTIPVGNDFLGRLSSTGDTDWVRVELVAETIYDIILDGVESARLLLLDAEGDVVARGSNFGSYTKLKVFSPDVSGTYFISIHSTDRDLPADYEISLEENPISTVSYDEIADYLSVHRGQVVSFDTETGGTLTVNITDLNETGQQLARWALEAWTNVTGIGFSYVDDDNAHITFDDIREGEELSAYARRTISNGLIVTSHVNIPEELLIRYGTGMDDRSFYLYLHEIGHALGLNHPGPYDVSSPASIDKIFLNDSWQATVMSYFHQDRDKFVDADFAYPVTPMIADIIAIQKIYGSPDDINAGDTVYGYGSNVDGYLDEVFARWTGEAGNPFEDPVTLTLFDGGGNDTLDLQTDTNDQRVDLRPEGISDVYGLTGNLVIARATLIENYIAGSGDDEIVGNAAANYLEGRNGNDALLGNSGDDVLHGGAGDDRLDGGSGDDVLEGGAGSDELNGGAGTDWLSYAGSDGAVSVRLYDGYAARGHAEGDTISGFENLRGSAHPDVLAGTGRDNRLEGGAGNDQFWGGSGDDALEGGAGADRFNGGPGSDRLSGGEDADIFVFVSGHGNDTITDFTDEQDLIDLTAFGLSGFQDLSVSSDANDVTVDLSPYGGGSILLAGFDIANLDATDFIF